MGMYINHFFMFALQEKDIYTSYPFNSTCKLYSDPIRKSLFSIFNIVQWKEYLFEVLLFYKENIYFEKHLKKTSACSSTLMLLQVRVTRVSNWIHMFAMKQKNILTFEIKPCCFCQFLCVHAQYLHVLLGVMFYDIRLGHYLLLSRQGLIFQCTLCQLDIMASLPRTNPLEST